MSQSPATRRQAPLLLIVSGVLLVLVIAVGGLWRFGLLGTGDDDATQEQVARPALRFQPRIFVDSSGFSAALSTLPAWSEDASLEELREHFDRAGYRQIEQIDQQLAAPVVPKSTASNLLILKALLLNYEGDAHAAYDVLAEAREHFERQPLLAGRFLGTLGYMQGVTALRFGETDNCVECRGASSCILPIRGEAVHQNREGSQKAIEHFRGYLEAYPDDLEVRWLLNLAHMTLGEYPEGVDPQYLVPLDRFEESESDIGEFRDIGHLVGLDRFNTAGGGIMDDFDQDGLLDVVVTASEPTEPMGLYRNVGDGTFREQTSGSGCEDQFGGLYCVQADYDNDGHLDIFIPRGAWLDHPIRPTLLRNDGTMHFDDVTESAGLDDAANSICAAWADYDNDGWLDLFVGCEGQPNRLYRNRGDGRFQEVAERAGVAGSAVPMTKGCAWIDFDNDNDPDLFTTSLSGPAILYRNDDGRFTDVSQELGIDGPQTGFACWSWDYNNDGWLDLFATSYDHTTADVVKGLLGEPHERHSNRLYRNLAGQGFEDVTAEAGLDLVFATMGSNFGDFDNDGYLDMYLGTGSPLIGMLVPNRMFRNVDGERFAEITASSRTGHLQKGHSVACGDWDRDGNVDVFMQMGGAVPGDRFHNVLFQNPGHAHHWITLRLIGVESNRSAIGTRVSVTTGGNRPRTMHRVISSGSSFGANPLELTIGLGSAERIESVQVHWPTSQTSQIFRDLPVDESFVVTEGISAVRRLEQHRIEHDHLQAR